MTTLRRYARSNTLAFGTMFGTSYAIPVIRENIKNGNIQFSTITLQERERLDVIAGKVYGDAKLWWVIASASDIGWALQVPPGTLLKIPLLDDVARFVG